jgi:hypothetical protein
MPFYKRAQSNAKTRMVLTKVRIFFKTQAVSHLFHVVFVTLVADLGER